MQAIEFPFKLGPDKYIRIPERLKKMFFPRQKVRVIILLEEPEEHNKESDTWNDVTAYQFLKGYHEKDAIYDTL